MWSVFYDNCDYYPTWELKQISRATLRPCFTITIFHNYCHYYPSWISQQINRTSSTSPGYTAPDKHQRSASQKSSMPKRLNTSLDTPSTLNKHKKLPAKSTNHIETWNRFIHKLLYENFALSKCRLTFSSVNLKNTVWENIFCGVY